MKNGTEEMKNVMGIKVEKGVPLPSSHGGPLYPWADLDVGDSFFVAGKSSSSINTSLTWANRKAPVQRFVSRTVTENGVKGVRVWRVS